MTHTEFITLLAQYPLFPEMVTTYALQISESMNSKQREDLAKELQEQYKDYEHIAASKQELVTVANNAFHNIEHQNVRHGVTQETSANLTNLESEV